MLAGDSPAPAPLGLRGPRAHSCRLFWALKQATRAPEPWQREPHRLKGDQHKQRSRLEGAAPGKPQIWGSQEHDAGVGRLTSKLAVKPHTHSTGRGSTAVLDWAALPRKGHMATSGDGFGCHNGGGGGYFLLASRGWRPGILLNILQHTGWPPWQSITPLHVAVLTGRTLVSTDEETEACGSSLSCLR